MQNIQPILAVIGVGMIAYELRWQVGFFMLQSIGCSKRSDFFFTLGVMLVAQNYIL